MKKWVIATIIVVCILIIGVIVVLKHINTRTDSSTPVGEQVVSESQIADIDSQSIEEHGKQETQEENEVNEDGIDSEFNEDFIVELEEDEVIEIH